MRSLKLWTYLVPQAKSAAWSCLLSFAIARLETGSDERRLIEPPHALQPADAFGTRAAMNLFWIWYWHIPLTMGRTLVITPSACNVDVLELVGYLGTSRASYVDCLTPSQIQLICELCDTLPPTLKHVFSSGEALTLATARAFLTKFPGVKLHNLLATTETSADICVLKDVRLPMVDRLLAAGHTHTPIVDRSAGGLHGVVWENRIRLVAEAQAESYDHAQEDAHEEALGVEGAPAAPGAGRVVVTGWNVERGYRIGGDPAAFAACDAHDPTSAVTSNRFASNDRAVWEGALLMIVGRTDEVVKVRGFRVDLSGVEAQLLECTALVEGVVITHDDVLWAMVVSADAEAVRAFVERTFEPSTRPVVLAVGAIPKTPTGKQDRKSLAEQLPELLRSRYAAAATAADEPKSGRRTEAGGAGGGSGSALPDGPTAIEEERAEEEEENKAEEEEAAAEGATRVLDAMQVILGFRLTPTEDLFSNGCTSLKAMRLAVALGVPIAAVFANPTASALARYLRGLRGQAEPEGPSQPTEAAGAEAARAAASAMAHGTTPPPPQTPSPPAVAPPAVASRPVYIAGMGIHMPGEVDSLGKLWQGLHAAADLTVALPPGDGDSASYVSRKGVVSLSGLPSQATLTLLGMSADVARRMGDEQRVALEVAVSALRDAGFDPVAPPARTGVFVSASSLYHPAADLDKMRAEQPDVYFGACILGWGACGPNKTCPDPAIARR